MKHHRFAVLTIMTLALACVGCYRKDVRTIEVAVPQMGAESCAKIIQEALARTDGIRSAKPDLNRRVMVVEYEALKLAIKNIEFVIAGAGFTAGTTEATESVRSALPAECR